MEISDLGEMSSHELDELFRSSDAGPIPIGAADGEVLLEPGTKVTGLAGRVVHLLAWQGKVFDPEKEELRNKILPFGLKAVRAKVYKQASWLDGKESIVLDYSKTSLIARRVRDEIRLVAPGLYLGIVYWEKDKVLDFALKFPT